MSIKAICLRIAAVLLAACPAFAQDWPSRPVTLLVAFPAGGSDDVLARIVAPRLSQLLGAPVQVENASGQGGIAGARQIARAPADGYRLMLGTSATHTLSQVLYAAPPYDASADFEPVALLAEQPFIVIARRDLPAGSLAELVAHSKRTATPLRYTSAGAGSATHLVCETLNARAGIVAQHAPRNGGVAALKALVDGDADYFCPVVTIAIPEVRAGKARAIALLGARRAPLLPDVRTAREQGLDDFGASTWFALFAPRGTPRPIVQRLNAAADAALDTPALRAELERVGAVAVDASRRSPDELSTFLRADIEKWRRAIRAAGIAPQ